MMIKICTKVSGEPALESQTVDVSSKEFHGKERDDSDKINSWRQLGGISTLRLILPQQCGGLRDRTTSTWPRGSIWLRLGAALEQLSTTGVWGAERSARDSNSPETCWDDPTLLRFGPLDRVGFGYA
ncbi:hypothetical protein V6N11_055187 [Hibiscus sabdariffa]|uniref:Uncharacterized protein n=1 Tax=Hibiscus sabdariffa TaxID=183260 RepID=A0ABR2PF45_9ROSI